MLKVSMQLNPTYLPLKVLECVPDLSIVATQKGLDAAIVLDMPLCPQR